MMRTQKIPEGGLLQSAGWAAVLRTDGKQVVEIGHEGQKLFGVVHMLSLVGSYLYIPRTPEISDEDVEEITKVAKAYNCSWVRMDFAEVKDFQNIKFIKAPHDMQPRENLIMDISGSEEDLLAAMKSKTRYNIRLAQRKGVVTHFVTYEDEDFDHLLTYFYTLVEATAQRKGVTFHPKAHYEAMFRELDAHTIALLAAEYRGDIIAANIVTFHNGTATYLHGATSDAHRNLMAPFLLQWDAICAAKVRGCVFYDLGGVFSDTKDPGKAGITRFKQGFTPQSDVTRGAGSWDTVLSPTRYWLYQFLQKIR